MHMAVNLTLQMMFQRKVIDGIASVRKRVGTFKKNTTQVIV